MTTRPVNPDTGLPMEHTKFLDRELMVGVLVLAVIFVVAETLPIAGTLALLLGPGMIAFYWARLGRLRGFSIITVAFLTAEIVGQYMGTRDTLFLSVLCVMGISLHELLRKEFPIEKTILITTGIVLLILLAVISFESIRSGTSPQRLVSRYIMASIEESLRISIGMGTNGDQLAAIKERLPQFSEWLTFLAPSVLGIGVAFVAWFDIIALRPLFLMRGLPFPSFGDLTRWKAPDIFIWILILSGFLVLIVPLLGINASWAAIIGANGLIVCLFVYFMQGIAIVEFFFRTRRVPRLLRLIFYALLFLQQYLILLVAVVSLFDLWVDWRRFPKERDDNNHE